MNFLKTPFDLVIQELKCVDSDKYFIKCFNRDCHFNPNDKIIEYKTKRFIYSASSHYQNIFGFYTLSFCNKKITFPKNYNFPTEMTNGFYNDYKNKIFGNDLSIKPIIVEKCGIEIFRKTINDDAYIYGNSNILIKELKDACKKNNFKGYSTKDKKGLVQMLMKM